jgi:hypothetical protein
MLGAIKRQVHSTNRRCVVTESLYRLENEGPPRNFIQDMSACRRLRDNPQPSLAPSSLQQAALGGSRPATIHCILRHGMSGQLAQLKAALADWYAVERELGSGGMATVYLAQDRKHKRYMAIKVLRPELASELK